MQVSIRPPPGVIPAQFFLMSARQALPTALAFTSASWQGKEKSLKRPGYEASAFNGVGAPKKTPTEIIYKLNVAVNAALVEDSEVQRRFAQLGTAPVSMTPGEFGKLIVDESDKWSKVFKAAGIKAE